MRMPQSRCAKVRSVRASTLARIPACQVWRPTGTGPATVRLSQFCPTTLTSKAGALADGVGGLYSMAAERGEIYLAGDRVADVPGLLVHALALWGGPETISCDRWRIAEVVQSLEAVGFPHCAISERGQGYMDGAEDVRLFKAALLDGHLQPQRGLLIRTSVGGARVMTDPAGNSKLHKRGGATCRGDVACAIIMAMAESRRRASQPQPEPSSYKVL